MLSLKNVKLAVKTPLLIVVPAISVVMIGCLIQLQMTARSVEADKATAYSSLVEEKGAAVERWLEEASVDVLALAESYAIISALEDFSASWADYDGAVADDLRRLYITDNPNPVGSKDELDAASDGSDWSAVHATHHVGLRAFQRARGYYDLFLFNLAGDLVYSVFKEDDFALNFENGLYAQSGLGEAFQMGLRATPGTFHMTEIAPYAPSAGAPAMFMSSPVILDGAVAGVVAVQLPLDRLASILSKSDLLGQTGDIFLVDAGGRSLVGSRFEGRFEALDPLPQSEQIRTALSGNSAVFLQTTGVAGDSVVSATTDVVTPNDPHWGMVLEVNRSEALSFVTATRISTAAQLLISAIIMASLGWLSVRAVVRRIGTLAQEMQQISDNDFSANIQGQDYNDEIGFISRTLANFKDKLGDAAEAQEREKRSQESNAEVVRILSESLHALAYGDFRNRITEFFPEEHKKLRYSINDAMESLQDVIASVREAADNIEQGSTEIARSADTLAGRTESQAATLAETAMALQGITESVNGATENVVNIEATVEKARQQAEASGGIVDESIKAMSEIEQSSSQISTIISVIDDIAFQTNLLALNAGVEAARAGDAGRGFAVVASEVRGLSQRSSEAAREIKTLIDQSGQQVGQGVKMVGRTGEALKGIASEVQEIAEMVRLVAKSSRDQSAALSEINTGVSHLDQATQENAAMAEENTAASQILRTDAQKLIEEVRQFKISDHEGEPGRQSAA
jgi:methyl-accepting chemotaxis protein